jgi:hypothetical protein
MVFSFPADNIQANWIYCHNCKPKIGKKKENRGHSETMPELVHNNLQNFYGVDYHPLWLHRHSISATLRNIIVLMDLKGETEL